MPERLRQIPVSPKKLHYRGNLPDWSGKFLCVVGSRKYTPYGKSVCENLIAGLSGYPITVVSGLALGIDGIAHEAALSAGLVTLAFPGSGLDWKVLYPSSHAGLAQKILERGGAIFSESEPDFRARPESFPQRNRIMAGISHAILVIEAELKSGTLITSRLATEYNRDVFTIPHSIFSKTGEGPHMLLKLGATLITSPSDILDAFDIGPEKKDTEFSPNKYADCMPDELLVIEKLTIPQSRDGLIRQLPFPASQVNSILTMLEIRGLVKEELGRIRIVN